MNGYQDKQLDCMNQYCRIKDPQVYPARFVNDTLYFCKDCLDLYQNKKCCYFCAQVYSDENENFLDGQKWIQCDHDKCQKWTHLDCEKKNGITEIDNLIDDQKYKYTCPWCRIEEYRKKPLKKYITNHNNFTKKTQKFIKFNRMRKNSNYEQPQTQQNISKSTYFDELLKKNGGFQQQVTQEEFQLDLQKMISLIKS